MATTREQIASDLAAAIVLYEQTFQWLGGTFPCVRRDQPTMAEMQEAGGEIEGVLYYLVVAKSVFNGPQNFPKNGDLINSDTHQIKKVSGHKDPAAVQLVLHIGSIDE